MTEQEQRVAGEVSGADDLDPDLAQALEAVAESLSATIGPLVLGFQQARDDLREHQQVVACAVPALVEAQRLIQGLVAIIDARGIRPNWAQERATLEDARALLKRLSPDGGTDATDTQADPGR